MPMSSFVIDYYLLVFTSSIGVIQISASVGRLNGLMFFSRRYFCRGFGVILCILAFIWFFISDNRNINDYEGGLDANIQALAFFLGAMTAVVITLCITSLVNINMKGDHSPNEGMEALKSTNYGRAVARSVNYWWRRWRRRTEPYSSG